METKERLCDLLYDYLVRDIKDRAYSTGKADAWVVTWHLREDTGWETKKLNYELSKLVKEGKLVKKTCCYYTAFRPISLEGYELKIDEYNKEMFYKIK